MGSRSRWTSSAAVGGLVLLCMAAVARAGETPASGADAPQQVGRIASLASGSIAGVVQDEKGALVPGATVSALGAMTAAAVTDRNGHFELYTLAPGPYLVRAHLSGYPASRGQIIEVRPSTRTSSSIAIRRATAAPLLSYPVLAAGIATAPLQPEPEKPADTVGTSGATGPAVDPGDDDHGEVAWRLRHARRGILKDVTIPDDLLAEDTPTPDANVFGRSGVLGWATGPSARLAANLFGGAPVSGQVHLLTTGSFDTPQQLFSTDSFSRSVAYVALAAPMGDADWKMRGAVTQGDFSSWIVAAAYTTRVPARHRYDVGLSYSSQRSDGGNATTLMRDMSGSSRTAGAVYGVDTFAITPAVALTYGARVSKYDYIDGRGLISPKVALTLLPADRFRVNAMLSRRTLAPGAEEFQPPSDSPIWLPPQRTFSSLIEGRPLQAERTRHMELEVERDLAAATVSVRGFRQHVDDQLVTMFGIDKLDAAAPRLGHYFVSNSGDVDATGWSAALRAPFTERVHGSIEYTLTRARWNPSADLAYLVLFAPSTTRLQSERIHDVTTTIETEVPETSTRVLVLCRVSNSFARPSGSPDRAALDSRFDVQVRQSLPFMDFSAARWEMLLAVRNFFRETSLESSVYDELLVVRPPKRIVGGLTLRF